MTPDRTKYNLVMEVRTEPIDCLHIEVLDGDGGTIMMDRVVIWEVEADANTDAKECYAGDGLFRLDSDTTDTDSLVNSGEWSTKTSDAYVDSLIANECKLWWKGSDDMQRQIREFLDHHIRKFYRDAADKVVENNN